MWSGGPAGSWTTSRNTGTSSPPDSSSRPRTRLNLLRRWPATRIRLRRAEGAGTSPLPWLFLSSPSWPSIFPPGTQSQVAAGLRATVLRPFLMTQEVLAQARLRAERRPPAPGSVGLPGGMCCVPGHPRGRESPPARAPGARRRAPRAVFVPCQCVFGPGPPAPKACSSSTLGSDQGVQTGDPVLMRNGRIGLVGVIREVRGGMLPSAWIGAIPTSGPAP